MLSDHVNGLAADCNLIIQGKEKNLLLAQKVMDSLLPYKQMIMEFGDRFNPAWIHLSYVPMDNRKQILIASKENNITIYKNLTWGEAKNYLNAA